MTLQELQKQVLQLSISDRWRLVESLLSSIERETRTYTSFQPKSIVNDLDPWTQSLIGIIALDEENLQKT